MDEYNEEQEEKEAQKGQKKGWDLSPLDKDKYYSKLNNNPSFAALGQRDPRFDKSNSFDKELKKKCIGENHIIITLSGPTGSGKSTAAVCIARAIEKINGVEFPNDTSNIQFTFEDTLNRISELPNNSTIIADESVLSMGMGSQRERTEIINVENTIRKKGINIIWVYPYENISHPTAHITLETFAISKEYKITKLSLKHENSYLGYIILPVKEVIESEFWKIYNKRKDAFIEDIISRKALKRDYRQLAITILRALTGPQLRLCDRLKNTILIIRDLSPNLTESELEEVARNILLLKKEKGL